ncbi:MAG TPA: glycosyltransferase family A protein [Vicinamibacterales bacterium]|nr:glycosyltransferase family A protein [Vicinamibacterales bacterium]
MTLPQGSSAAPRVSVVVPAYNSAHFIEGTLQTALDQTFRDLEILVVDDGSDDRTADVVRGVMARDSRVRVLVQPHRGLSAARNHAIGAARGEFIALLDHDDLWHPRKLALQVALLDAHDEVAVVSCYSALIDERHRCLGWQFGGAANGDVYAEMLEWDMVSGGSVPLIRRAAIDQIGRFDETLALREDWDAWIRLARRERFATVPLALVGYTRSASNSSRDYEGMAREGTVVLKKILRDDPAFSARYRFCQARDYFSIACFCAIDRRPALAWKYVVRSAMCAPAPLLRSPRRCAFVGVLALQSLMPRALFQPLFGAITRIAFQLEPGRPFLAPMERS